MGHTHNRESRRHAVWIGFLFAVMALAGLSTPAMAQVGTAHVQLQWTAPGDDGTIGTASAYEVRYSTAPVTAATWAQATAIPDVLPAPKPSGSAESFVVSVPDALLGDTYYVAIRARDEAFNWAPVSNNASFVYELGSDVGDDGEGILPILELRPNYPNPFNAQTAIPFSIPTASHVEISIYNSIGQRVKVLVDGYYGANTYSVIWDGTSQSGFPVASGTYFYRMITNGTATTRSMTLLK